ncbi:enoyl-CoA hydratase/isomerase family protein [Aureimonas altamirensis]|uniref:enoyl-CoA hydratase/isomerase family protein n=1 Tax=Aureimonas altamirensis TaxID=370622 RepID=UPI002036BA7A|nr:enoyl-CoA hydratase/isomerase family protein [Aureimonas altamirensis]MCM2503788.1 enoyl-CoA hydratase/isomerase family protein [Aureimonas altamirensis]
MTGKDGEAPVLAFVEGRAGVIRLNRPAALNALNIEMVDAALRALATFETDLEVDLVLLEGAGGRAFCAGGDIRFVAASARAGDGQAEEFWRREYALVLALAQAAKPVVALMDGIVMGGGAGLGIHVRHRIVTDGTRFAMPEVGIGFVPDVGSTFLLARAPGETGRYLALTGDTFDAADVIHAGLADSHVPADSLPALREALVHGEDGVDQTIARFATRPGPGLFAEQEAAISRAFRHDGVQDIVEALGNRSTEFARRTLDTLNRRSPRSLLATMELLRRAKQAADLSECLVNEFHAACRCLASPDYHEGVRAAVIDKDRNPHWACDTLEGALEADGLDPVPGVADPDFAPDLGPARLPAALRAAH